MELDTSPFHTLQTYETNSSVMLAFQFLFPRVSNKQSKIFDRGGDGDHDTPKSTTDAMDVSSSAYLSHFYEGSKLSDSRGYEGRENMSMCLWRDLREMNNNKCRVRLDCEPAVLCDAPVIGACVDTYPNNISLNDNTQSNSSVLSTFCASCPNQNSELSERPEWPNNSTKCDQNECFVDISCSDFDFIREDQSVSSSFSLLDKANYTIEHLINPFYSNASSYLLRENSPHVGEPCAAGCNSSSALLTAGRNLVANDTKFESIFSVSNFSLLLNPESPSNWSQQTGKHHSFDAVFDDSSHMPGTLSHVNATFQQDWHEYDFSFLFLTLFILMGGSGNILVCLSVSILMLCMILFS